MAIACSRLSSGERGQPGCFKPLNDHLPKGGREYLIARKLRLVGVSDNLPHLRCACLMFKNGKQYELECLMTDKQARSIYRCCSQRRFDFEIPAVMPKSPPGGISIIDTMFARGRDTHGLFKVDGLMRENPSIVTGKSRRGDQSRVYSSACPASAVCVGGLFQ